jgi:3-hydroxyisobutyrate dehydrogenase
MSRIAILGTGLLGSAFAEGLLRRGGTQVIVWNRTRAKLSPLEAQGAIPAESPADAVSTAVRVHLVLLDDDTVDATLAECLPALKPGVVIVDHTTTRPDRTAARAAALDSVGVQYLHAPVMMGPGAARDAKGMMLVAGPTERVDRVREGLSVMTGELWHVGERADLAAVYKLFGNAGILSVIGVLADIMRLADANEVDRAQVLTMLAKVNMNAGAGVRGPMMVNGDFPPQFTLDVARKDIRLMLESAGATPLPMLHALAGAMDAQLARGNGGEDFAVIGKR